MTSASQKSMSHIEAPKALKEAEKARVDLCVRVAESGRRGSQATEESLRESEEGSMVGKGLEGFCTFSLDTVLCPKTASQAPHFNLKKN